MDMWKTLCCFCANAQGALSDFLHLPSLSALKKDEMKIGTFFHQALYSSQEIFQYHLANEIILPSPLPNLPPSVNFNSNKSWQNNISI